MHAKSAKASTLALGVLLPLLLITGCSDGQPPAQEPAPSASESAAEPTVEGMRTEQIANGYFQLQVPQDWGMNEIQDEFHQFHPDSSVSLQFTNPEGETVATLRTGSETWQEDGPPTDPEDNILIDSQSISAQDGPHFSFVVSSANPDTGLIALSSSSPDLMAENRPTGRPFNYDGGAGTFYRDIEPNIDLQGVERDLHGTERMRAYTETEEYQQLKAMMLSFEQLKVVEGEPPQESGE